MLFYLALLALILVSAIYVLQSSPKDRPVPALGPSPDNRGLGITSRNATLFAPSEERGRNRVLLLLYGAFWIPFHLFVSWHLQTIAWSAWRAMMARQAVISIDPTFMMAIFSIAATLAVMIVLETLNINYRHYITSLALIFGGLFGGMFLMFPYGEPIVSKMLADHGYSRCQAQDVHIGHGRGSIYLRGYVRNGVACAARDAAKN